MASATGHEFGKTYLSKYWNKRYTVIDIHKDVPIWGDEVSVKWEDGSVTRHCTHHGNDPEVN